MTRSFRFENWNLVLVWDLEFVIWNLSLRIAGIVLLTLTLSLTPIARSLKWAPPQDADCKPDPVAKNHLSSPGVAAGVQQPTRGIGRESLERPLFSFAPDGVCLSPGTSPPGTVSSCLTFSPLPCRLAAARWSVLCDTVLPPRTCGGESLLGIILPCGVRTFLPTLTGRAILHPRPAGALPLYQEIRSFDRGCCAAARSRGPCAPR